jgi:hypothetical protein
LAEYTGATERIALGKKSRQAEKNRIKLGVAEMIEDVQMYFTHFSTFELVLNDCHLERTKRMKNRWNGKGNKSDGRPLNSKDRTYRVNLRRNISLHPVSKYAHTPHIS